MIALSAVPFRARNRGASPPRAIRFTQVFGSQYPKDPRFSEFALDFNEEPKIQTRVDLT